MRPPTFIGGNPLPGMTYDPLTLDASMRPPTFIGGNVLTIPAETMRTLPLQ